jgi:hypothetical protein
MNDGTDLRTKVERWFRNEINRMLVLIVIALLFGVGSLISFLLNPDSGATRVELALLILAMMIIFHVALRYSTY